MNLEAAKAELAADVVEALAIAFGQFPLRALFQPADGDHDEAHEYVSGDAALSGMRAFARVTQTTCASADSHRPNVQIAFAAAGFCVHNLSRL